ncbi:MAG: ferredoxin [Erythrobacter sp.]
MYQHEPYSPHPANVPGQFYVGDGCCTGCNVPEDIAPDLFEWVDSDSHCRVKKQPETQAEFDRMLDVMKSQEMFCIRARFCSPLFFERLKAAGEADQVDTKPKR